MTPVELSIGIFAIVMVLYFSICVLFVIHMYFFEDGGVLDRWKSWYHDWYYEKELD